MQAAKDAAVSSAQAAHDEAPEELTTLGEQIAAGNAKAFAKACSYPIERPYPLRNIADTASMESYFPVMIDDSIKQVIKSADSSRWHNTGWRGWTLDNGEYLWWDGDLYAVNYVSAAEKALLKRLADEEMESLAPELRKGWRPYFCLIGVDMARSTALTKVLPIQSQPAAFQTLQPKQTMLTPIQTALTDCLYILKTATSTLHRPTRCAAQ